MVCDEEPSLSHRPSPNPWRPPIDVLTPATPCTKPNADFAVLHAGEPGAERLHQLLAVKRLPDAVLALPIVHDPLCFRGA